MKVSLKSPNDAASESAFMPMADALLVILSIFFVSLIIMNIKSLPSDRARPPITIPSDQYFETDRFLLTEANRLSLHSLLRDSLQVRYDSLKDDGGLSILKFIIVEGHADRRSRQRSHYAIETGEHGIDGNEELSYFRAFTVYRMMTEIFENSSIFSGHVEKLIVAGSGSRRLKCETLEECGEEYATLNVEGRHPDDIAQNRRIEIHFVFRESRDEVDG